MKAIWKRFFRPAAIYPSLAAVDWNRMAARGYSLLLLDIDNTLMPHGRHSKTEAAGRELERIRKAGLKPVLLSNAREERARSVGASLGADVIGNAGKPSARGIRRALAQYRLPPERVIAVGDQVFTDLLAARSARVPFILVDPINPKEPFYIRLKRLGERLIGRPGLAQYYDELPNRKEIS
ncbi:MAG: HAD family hydrolase [Bacillota bacterium]|nr:HAD family hydrolase [Bacillota bacterium]